jgi:hypothetical protein
MSVPLPRFGVIPMLRALAFCILAFSAGWCAGASPQASAIEEVRNAYAQCSAVQKQARPVELYERSSGRPSVESWQRERPPEEERSGRAMTLFLADGTLRMALERVNAPSGDWRQSIRHCFRSDGSLAFVFSVLRTFHGNVQVQDRLYFNPRGESIRKLRRVSDLSTGKPIKAEEGSFMEQEVQLFRSADDLLRALGREVVFPPASK